MFKRLPFLVLVFGLTTQACGGAAPKPDESPVAPAAVAAPVPTAPPAAAAATPVVGAAEEATCPVSGEKFKPTADTPRSDYKGKSYAFCCAGCKKKFDADPEKFLGKAAAAPAAGEVACPVSGEKFVPTAESPRSEYQGKSYAFCCAGCKKKFDAAPDKFLASAGKAGEPCAGDCPEKDGKPCDEAAKPADKAAPSDKKPAAVKGKR